MPVLLITIIAEFAAANNDELFCQRKEIIRWEIAKMVKRKAEELKAKKGEGDGDGAGSSINQIEQ